MEMEMNMFAFGEALARLWQDQRVRRNGWISHATRNRWLEMRTDLELSDGDPTGYPRICYASETDKTTWWAPSQTDLMAADWVEVEQR